MLNKTLADEARNQLVAAVERLQKSTDAANKLCVELYEVRRSSSHELIPQVEAFVNSLAARPKEYDRTFAEFHVERGAFDTLVQRVNEQFEDAFRTSGGAAGAGVALGTAAALVAPAAAMAIATTFGTASTGVAISTLSGAAAANAALAWLGGGALVAGGSGMAGGGTLLALAGPVGWGLAAVSLAGGAVYYRMQNTAIAEEATTKSAVVEARRRATDGACREILSLFELTKTQVAGMKSLLAAVREDAPADYRLFDSSRKQMLGALVNHVHTLCHLLNKTVGEADVKSAGASTATSNS